MKNAENNLTLQEHKSVAPLSAVLFNADAENLLSQMQDDLLKLFAVNVAIMTPSKEKNLSGSKLSVDANRALTIYENAVEGMFLKENGARKYSPAIITHAKFADK